MQYDGTKTGVLIADDADPWVEVDGKPVDWTATSHPRVECPCGEGFNVVLPGVIDGMNTPQGVQRCDACATYDGDLDAALALAQHVGGTAHFHESKED